MTLGKIKPRASVYFISARLQAAIQAEFNRETQRAALTRKPGFGKSAFIDEWFNWNSTRKGIDFWSMANHLFQIVPNNGIKD